MGRSLVYFFGTERPSFRQFVKHERRKTMIDPSNFPMVSLDINHAKHSIKIALGEHMDKVKDDLDTAIDHAVDNFDFQGLVSEAVKGI